MVMEKDPYILGSQYYRKKKKNQGEHFQRIYICYSPAGRSLLEITVPEVFDQHSRQRARFFPIRTDLSWEITFLFIFRKFKEMLAKITQMIESCN